MGQGGTGSGGSRDPVSEISGDAIVYVNNLYSYVHIQCNYLIMHGITHTGVENLCQICKKCGENYKSPVIVVGNQQNPVEL